jgi:hypothetical protein
MVSEYLHDLKECELCEHRCRVNRLAGETGVCRVTLPAVASATLHPAPPESYTVFMAGCNYKCLNCQNWSISQYPDNGISSGKFIDPKKLAAECIERLNSPSGMLSGLSAQFCFGKSPRCHANPDESMRHGCPECRTEKCLLVRLCGDSGEIHPYGSEDNDIVSNFGRRIGGYVCPLCRMSNPSQKLSRLQIQSELHPQDIYSQSVQLNPTATGYPGYSPKTIRDGRRIPGSS